MNDGERNLNPEMIPGQPAESSVPVWLKRLIQSAGLILLIFGLPVAINLFCIVPLVLMNSTGSDVTIYGVVSLTVALLTAGAGLAAFVHANNSLHNKPSKPMHLPSPPLLLLGGFVLLIAFGTFVGLGGESPFKTLIMMAVGFLLAVVGIDVVSGRPRLTFGSLTLLQGFHFVPITIGLFGIGEVLYKAGVGTLHTIEIDRDRVANKSDRCPDTPLGASVDRNGCPVDTRFDSRPPGGQDLGQKWRHPVVAWRRAGPRCPTTRQPGHPRSAHGGRLSSRLVCWSVALPRSRPGACHATSRERQLDHPRRPHPPPNLQGQGTRSLLTPPTA